MLYPHLTKSISFHLPGLIVVFALASYISLATSSLRITSLSVSSCPHGLLSSVLACKTLVCTHISPSASLVYSCNVLSRHLEFERDHVTYYPL